MKLGDVIRLVRVAKGLDQGEVAKKAGLSRAYVSHLELNQRDPTLSTMTKLSVALAVPLSLMVMLIESEDALLKPFMPLAFGAVWSEIQKGGYDLHNYVQSEGVQ